MSKIAGFTGERRQDRAEILAASVWDVSELNVNTATLQERDFFTFISNNPGLTANHVCGVSVLFSGYIFNSDELNVVDSDAEAFLSSYLHIGFEATLIKINGDFSVAVFDLRSNELFLARDRFGVRPLYWILADDNLAFCSRPLPLARLLKGGVELDRGFVARYAGGHYRYFDNTLECSPYRDVFQLPAGHWLRFNSGVISAGSYWGLIDQTDFKDSEEVLAEQYRALLLDSVSLRLKKVRYPAFTLSGGMDSSSVLSCATKSKNERFSVYSCVYTDKTFDESDDIEVMRCDIAKNWNAIVLDKLDVFGLVEEMIRCHEEPVATATWLSHYLLCREASKHDHDALFGGLGGDELNAGEYEYFYYFFADLLANQKVEQLSHEIAEWVKHHNHVVFRKSREIAIEVIQRTTDLQIMGKCLPDMVRLNKYSSTVNKDYFDLSTFVPIMETPFKSYLKNRTFQDLTRETVPCCLRAEERQTSVFGMQSIDPFLDYRLVEFMFRVPSYMKIQHGVTKKLLRRAMEGIVPEETRSRIKKTGWNAPAHVWFSGRGLNDIYDLVHSQSFREGEIYIQSEVLKILDSHKRILCDGSNQENHMMFLWQLINLQVWRDQV